MPLARSIKELFEAIPDRIEVSGHSPTWRECVEHHVT